MTQQSVKPASEITHYLVDAGVVVESGDLMWFDGTYAQPASAMPDQSSLAANQAYFAFRFIGVAHGATNGTETADTEIAVQRTGCFQYTCASTAWKNEDIIAAVENAAGDGIENQVVAKSTTASHTIGRSTCNGTKTNVEFEINPFHRERIVTVP